MINWDKIWVGSVLGLFSPIIAFFVFFKINYTSMALHEFIRHMKLADSLTSVISLSVLINLLLFFPYIWKEKYNGARGVLGSTLLWAVFVMVLKFI